MEEIFKKKCFGKNRCWNNVRRKCPIAGECALKAEAEKRKRIAVIGTSGSKKTTLVGALLADSHILDNPDYQKACAKTLGMSVKQIQSIIATHRKATQVLKEAKNCTSKSA